MLKRDTTIHQPTPRHISIHREELEQIDFTEEAKWVNLMAPVTPGEILREEFMQPFGLSAKAVTKALHVPPNRIAVILDGPAPLLPAQCCGSPVTSIRPRNPV